MGQKREIPPALQKLLALDVHLTNQFCIWANHFLPLKSLRIHYKFLEVSCHGVPWIAAWLAFIWLWDHPSLYQMQMNFLIGLLLDIVLVAVLKAVTRRRRPVANKSDMFGVVGPDKFSFPSGHASRATMVACFFLWVWPVHFLFQGPILAWAGSVCLSRLLLQRHHILDVTAGVLLGVFETWFIYNIVWLSQESATWAVSWLSDERTDGGSYHV
ncbi:phospholipid phosphatase 6 [Schistocerca americana]|uniref:phospholipid phosphatase 6 n=1 Tax=Schistocerca americana TaxID=7009 RepID=UPI001F5041F7|nr:phospholipid phosphatase 6 [Schistocerca americana]XP_047114755.1 polyisoprenoid diphosphate/phosphate phosphohydrolase PLPP6 isoform X1 [Schistocerca piceifrons]XP_049827959.1 polyisoprenoid diphosphate/phosphate phosphohydrolase PLPP6 [Schistocerca gregaria]XP_049827960.1 polyisoprenoid diphosphate/phosphate phosphohydrolase PLPP6 [Schistocerca gregaria]XP_049961292.1 polyisoprenoid diphosphate/phosphate phosphohydrolase PLPP6 [Schistocerca serialis cubense]